MAKKAIEHKVTDDPRYHDTWRLLKKYRDVVWSLEVSVQQVRSKFQIEYGSSIEDFLESIYLAGADLGGSEMEHHAQCIERSWWKMPWRSFVPTTKTARRTTGFCTTPISLLKN